MAFRKELIEKAGIPAQDLQLLETAWEAYEGAKGQPVQRVPRIVCTGIYNAGKSTLLNALTGTERFPTGDVPTTKALAEAELDGAVYIDTPGLNAEEEDDRETQAAYETADFLLFVSSAVSGGISQAEAAWLRTLRERYTQEGLRQRLIFVLTKCGQADREQLPEIVERFRQDLENTVGFGAVIPVDSVTYQKGAAEGKALLVEHSGIPDLKKQLAEKISAADKLLSLAREEERAQRKREVVEILQKMENVLQQRLDKASTVITQKEEIDALVQKAAQELESVYANSAYVSGIYISRSMGTTRFKRMGVFSSAPAEEDAKRALNRYAGERVSEAKREIDKCVQEIKKSYFTTGVNSAYAQYCSKVNQVLESFQLALQQQGILVMRQEEVRVEPDADSLARLPSCIDRARADVEFYEGNGLFDTYYDVFGNRFEERTIEDSHYKKTLFGEKLVTDVGTEVDAFRAMADAFEQIQEQTRSFERNARDSINDVLRPFLKALHNKADQHLSSLYKVATEHIKVIGECATEPIQTALTYLETLEREVS